MKYLLTIIISFAIGTIGFADQLLNQVKTKYDKITTIQGNFTQTICSDQTGTCQQFEGKFSITRPYFSRLEVTSPEKQTIVTDSQYVYIYLVDKKKVYLQQADAGINFFKIFDMFLNEPEHYTITDKDSLHTVFAYKKDSLESSTVINDLTLSVNNYTKLIEQFSFTDMTDTEMKFDLTNIKTNVKLSDKTFRLVIPKDVELIQY
ncbi:MAG: outer membrane lipoprotein carrier protein LolA [Candidatus Latescibacteria bacterium]|nr:outer membrane lipoprotein carrier protein LolA [Candidatus Latescibacterota bacterium]